MADSTPSTPKPATGIAALTAREVEVLGLAWSCLKTGPPEIDYEKLARELNMANHRSAANLWGAIKKKMAWPSTATPAAGKSTTASKRKKSIPAKAAAAAKGSDDEDEDGSPAPKKKKTASKPKAAPRKKPTGKTAKTPAAAEDSGDNAEGAEGADGESQDQSVKPEPEVKAEPVVNEENSGDDVV